MCRISYLFLEVQGQQSLVSTIVAFGGLIIVVLAISFLIIFIYSRQRQNQMALQQQIMKEEFEKQLMQVQIEVQEHTSATLSQELHDNIGQLLTSTRILINLTGRSLPAVPETLQSAEDTLGRAIHDLRSLAKSLNRDWLHRFDLLENLEAEKARINATRTIDFQLHHNITRLPLKADSQLMLFRIIQEAVQNCIKHAGPRTIGIELEITQAELDIRITDDGRGFDPGVQTLNGVGLMNMRYRTRLLGGKIEWRPAIAAGTEVEIRLPLGSEETSSPKPAIS
jgi:signal transduction histidine kinase